MRIQVVLFSMLREKLARDSQGRLVVELPEGSTLAALLAELGLSEGLICTRQGQIERDLDCPLQDGDEVHLIQPAGGG